MKCPFCDAQMEPRQGVTTMTYICPGGGPLLTEESGPCPYAGKRLTEHDIQQVSVALLDIDQGD